MILSFQVWPLRLKYINELSTPADQIMNFFIVDFQVGTPDQILFVGLASTNNFDNVLKRSRDDPFVCL